MPTLSRITLFLSVLGNGIDIARVADRSEGVTISFQVLLRIFTTFFATVCGMWGWWRFQEVRQSLISYRGLFACLLVAGALSSAITSPSPKVAAFVAIAIGSYLLLSITCVVMFGFVQVLKDVLMALWCFVILSWLLYIFVPSLATFHEYLSIEETLPRFGGLGHPNVLSAILSLGMLLVLVLAREKHIAWRWVIPCVLLFIVTIVAAKSRTPIIAFGAAFLCLMRPLIVHRATYLFVAACILSVTLAAIAIEATEGIDRTIDSLALSFTKTGTIDELTSATGRTEIWSRAIALIEKSPLTGYGGGLSSQIMVEHSGHAHNLFLETALLFGIPTMLLFSTLILISLTDCLRTKHLFIPEFLTFLLVLGLVESPLFGLVPDPTMCIWLSCVFAPVIDTTHRTQQGIDSTVV